MLLFQETFVSDLLLLCQTKELLSLVSFIENTNQGLTPAPKIPPTIHFRKQNLLLKKNKSTEAIITYVSIEPPQTA